MHFVDRHREKIRQSPMSSRLLWACLLLVVLLYEKLRRVDAMGGGDLKLLFLTGLYLGWLENLLGLLLACLAHLDEA